MTFFPATRLRRNRSRASIRRLVREHRLCVDDLILPLFVMDGGGESISIENMSGIYCHTIEGLFREVERAESLGIPAVALFPRISPDLKDERGSQAVREDNLICRSLRAVRERFPAMSLISDVALDPFTSHGHDGVLVGDKIVNDETCEILAEQALVQAGSGCDILAPSDMMDGRIGIIRGALDEGGYDDVCLLSYSVKYASNFYSPFRGAVGSAEVLLGDKSTYQMDFGNSSEAVREAEMDIDEGADMLMVKPGLLYLDIVRLLSDMFEIPIFGYHVSGEYVMLRNAIDGGYLPESCIMESLLAFKRAGASAILSYFALDAAEKLRAEG